ncbi:MAG: glycoside hydrolase family 28 protein [Candidatus Cryptobacteroides sp.]
MNHISCKLLLPFLLASMAGAMLVSGCSSYEYAELYENLPFEMSRVYAPGFPDFSVSVADFGGVGDGTTLNTEAFAQAVDALVAKGGGHLIVPKGVWLSGPVILKDNIDLHVEKDAVLLFSTDRDLYPIVETVFEGLDTKRCMPQIYADGAKNIAVTGGGTIDGNGDSWRQVKKSKMASAQWKALLASGGFTNAKGDVWYPDSSSFRGSIVSDAFNVPQGLQTDEEWNSVKTYLRPVLVGLKNCENVLLKDCLFQNSPCWNIHPLMCRNLLIDNISVRNPWYSQNGDGIDIDSCDGVILVNSNFDVGDDAICIKSGKDEDGRRRAMPCRNLIVDNCVVFHGHGGFVVGSEMSGGVQNISVTNCRFLGTDVGLRFKSCRGRGGVVENIHIKDIVMKDIPTEPLLFDLHYGGKSALEAVEDGASPFDVPFVPADETTPQFKDIFISDIVCSSAARAMYFNGIPEMPIENIVVKDCIISADKGADLRYSEGIVLKDVVISRKSGAGFSFAHCKDISMKDCFDNSGKGSADIFQYSTEGLSIN